MTSTAIYTRDLRTELTHLRSTSLIETDAPTDNSGKGERFSPTDLLATSLAACMLTVMGIKAKSMGVELEGLKIGVEKIMIAEPRRVSGINLTVYVPDSLAALDLKSKSVLQNTAETCPVMKSIHPDIKVMTDWGRWL
ncbi:MAG: OsmC family protein [Chitinophagaceae bacterium]